MDSSKFFAGTTARSREQIVGAASEKAPRISAHTSLNFSVAKVLAIFTVLAGHWFTGTILWIPVTFGLFVFAFSSSYFTARIYGVSVNTKRFWRTKLERLGLRYWVSLCFLGILVILRGGTISHWHTVLHFLGLSGILNWLAIPNRSGLGAGLWFFTLLLFFYITYPFLAKICEAQVRSRVFALLATAAAIFLETEVKVGHELWLTSLGFILGVVFGTHLPSIRASGAALCFGLASGALVVLNVGSGHREFNIILIAAASISIALWLLTATFHYWSFAIALAKFEKYLLEIFLIHTYLFIHFTGNTWLDFLVSLVLIIITAILLGGVVDWLAPLVFARKPVR